MVRTLARSLAATGIETDVATTDDNGLDRLDVRCDVPSFENGVTYRYFRRQLRFYTFSWPLSQWLAKHIADYDLVHIHALFSYASVPAAFWAARHDIPYIVRPLGTLNRWGMEHRRPRLKALSFRWIESRILRNAAFIHYTSEQECLEAKALGVTSRWEIVPNALSGDVPGCPPGRFRARYPQLRHRKIILFLSRFDAKKGLDLLLPAFARVRSQDRNVTLVLAGAGDPDLVARVQEQAQTHGIGSDVIWAGFLRGEEKQAALTDADLFVLPSYSENFGIAATEAMAAGLPVVVSDQVAIHHEIAAAQAGLVVPCQIEPLNQALLNLLNDAQLRSAMGQNGKRLTQQQYALEVVTGKLVSLYNEIAR